MTTEDVGDETPAEIGADPRECRYELPPLDGSPFTDAHEQAKAVLRVVEQAERERAEEP